MIRRTKDGGIAIVCVRGEATEGDIEKIFGPVEKDTMTSIPCGNGDHEDCGGDGCKCRCHEQHTA